jgi:hypothetical protein
LRHNVTAKSPDTKDASPARITPQSLTKLTTRQKRHPSTTLETFWYDLDAGADNALAVLFAILLSKEPKLRFVVRGLGKPQMAEGVRSQHAAARIAASDH